MGKRAVLILLVLLITCLLFLGYIFHKGRTNFLTDPYTAIPAGACFVIETPDLQNFMNSLTSGTGITGELINIKEFEPFNKSVKFISDQLNKDDLKNIVGGRSAVISFFDQPDGSLKTLLTIPIQNKLKPHRIKELLLKVGVKDLHEKSRKGKTIFEAPYSINKSRDTIFISSKTGILVCSTSRNLINSSLGKTEEEKDVRSEPGFLKILLASGEREDKVFIVFENLPDLIKPLFNKNNQVIADKISKLAGSGGGDIFLNDNGLILSGYTESPVTTEFLYRYKSIEPAEFHTSNVLPPSTVLFETMILPLKFPVKSNDKASVKAVSLAKSLNDYLGEEITRAYLDIRDSSLKNNTLILYELDNRLLAERAFLNQMGEDSLRNNVLLFTTDNNVTIPVYKTPFQGLVSVILPEFSSGIDDTYFTFYDNFLVTGSSFSTISIFLNDNIHEKTLENDIQYREFESTLPSRAVYYLYCVPGRLMNYMSNYLSDEINTAVRTYRTSLNKIQNAGFILAPSNGMIYNTLSLKYRNDPHQQSTKEWETLLDAAPSGKPFFFTNHINGSREIFIQDELNNIYLINSAGRILWKVALNEKINGSVYMIDFYRNGKNQLLFAGKNYLHLIDRNGEYVERYPVRLKSPSTNPLALIDYDKTKDYRLLIAGEDKKIYSYDKNGNMVKGWKPFTTAGIVKQEINFFKVSGKDYLIASDDISVYFIDRQGNKRLNLKEPVVRATGSSLRLLSGSESYITFSSPDGTVNNIYFNGQVKSYSFRKFSGNHFFDISDIDGDGFSEYMFVDKGTLTIYDNDKTEIFSKDLGTELLSGPVSFNFSSTDNKIGVVDYENKLVCLVDEHGDNLEGFPVKGSSMFSIGKLSDNSWNLIVGGNDRYLYNYKIESAIK